MKTTLLIVFVVLVSWLQVLFPAQIAPWHLIPDIALLLTFGIALHYEPSRDALWYGLAAGLAIDLWSPSLFGAWSLACIVVVLVTRVVHKRLLPRNNWTSTLATAALALGAAELALALWVDLFNGFSVFGGALLRIYAPRLLLDLVLVLPAAALMRSILRALRVTSDTSLIVTNGSRR